MKALIDNLLSTAAAEAVMQSIIDQVKIGSETDDDVACLADVLGRSGNVLSLSGSQPLADLASTGGPTSLSTLLGPLYLRAFGCCVPKLGVPGRPAGGVDVLAQIPGYEVNLNAREVMNCIGQCGYAHFVANEEHAPLDARLFRFRQQAGAQNLPALAIASLLAKKIAVGVKHAGLDIRVAPHGNFGATWEDARGNAQRFSRVAAKLGLDAVCFLTDARFPYQPFIGRGESLLALLEIFEGTDSHETQSHAKQCLAMAASVAKAQIWDVEAIAVEAKSLFARNLVAQGSSVDAFESHADQIRSGHRFEVVAREHGFVSLRLDRLRDVIVRFQSVGTSHAVPYPDGLGVILRKMPAEFVQPGDIVATVRVPEEHWESLEPEIAGTLLVTKDLELASGFEKVANG